ncbi:anti-phage protein KwaB [Undibacterium sp. SXout7W]|uniref:anti-phage protein KwaB n=1 Tax=Undibacterium sp. SXout7W TaxID=3413049 RepID=UPI003BF02791
MKTIEELRTGLAEILHADGINLKLYLGTENSQTREYRLADFADGATEAVCRQFVASIDQFLLNEDLATKSLTELDHRTDTLFVYDLDEQPVEFAKLSELVTGDDPDVFNFAERDLADVTSLAIKISSAQNSVLFFKKFYPVSLVKRDQILLVLRDNTRFSLIDQDILKVTGGFEVLRLGDEFYINDFGKFEKSFAFDQIAKNAIGQITAKIVASDLVSDVKGYLAAGFGSRKDILRARKSRVLNMDVATVIAFAQAKQQQIGIKVADGKLLLSSKDSIKKLYRLLNDDYLTSELTHVDYETLAKNELTAAPNPV